jgi:hypothetical protein
VSATLGVFVHPAVLVAVDQSASAEPIGFVKNHIESGINNGGWSLPLESIEPCTLVIEFSP